MIKIKGWFNTKITRRREGAKRLFNGLADWRLLDVLKINFERKSNLVKINFELQ